MSPMLDWPGKSPLLNLPSWPDVTGSGAVLTAGLVDGMPALTAARPHDLSAATVVLTADVARSLEDVLPSLPRGGHLAVEFPDEDCALLEVLRRAESEFTIMLYGPRGSGVRRSVRLDLGAVIELARVLGAFAVVADAPRLRAGAAEFLDGLREFEDGVGELPDSVRDVADGGVAGLAVPVPGVAVSGAGEVFGSGSGHGSSPSVGRLPGGAGGVDGSLGAGTPRDDAPTVGDTTGTAAGPSAVAVPVSGPPEHRHGPFITHGPLCFTCGAVR